MNTTSMPIASNRVQDIKRHIRLSLCDSYSNGELESVVRILFEAFMGWDSTQLLLHGNETVNQSDLLRFYWAVEALRKGQPIQQVVGYTDFGECRIFVNSHTLIPRPETEELALRAIQIAKTSLPDHPHCLDLCTGSGCIAIALSKALPNATVWGADISEPALKMACHNAVSNHVEVSFIYTDLMGCTDTIHSLGKMDLIISNPPYVMEHERAQMHRRVLDFEPDTALFVPDCDPLKFYRSIAILSQSCLDDNGVLMLEINEKLGTETIQLIKSLGFEGDVLQDFWGKDRFVVAHHCR
ncbi:MAG: peptide chain release factor N(5)-glutamine methyltransferase [Bacteroidales bacterium]|nr:peptide chain release factor N(5)-glutamine methyltransferase [Candidatus Colimorpha onthohippi]